MVDYFEDLDCSVETLGVLQGGDKSRVTTSAIAEARRRGRYLRGRAFRLAMAALLVPFVAIARRMTAGLLSLRSKPATRRSGGPFALTPPLSPPLSPPLPPP